MEKFKFVFTKIKKCFDKKTKDFVVKDMLKEELADNDNVNTEFNNAAFGTIIWGKRYYSEYEKDIPGYKICPFLVIGKKDEKLICMKGTSVIPEEKRKRIFFDAGIISNNKKSFFRLYNIEYIDSERYVHLFDNLSQDKLRELYFLSIKLNEKDLYNILSSNECIYQLVKPGDIIKYYNKYWYVCMQDNNTLLCLNIKKLEEFNGKVNISIADIDYINPLCIEKNANIDLLGCVCIKQKSEILKMFKTSNFSKNATYLGENFEVYNNDEYLKTMSNSVNL